MDNSTRGKPHDLMAENGDRLLKLAPAAAEQINIAKRLSKPGTDVELRKAVVQLQELTQCTEDHAVTALYDCENNLERAVELLLDKFRGVDDGWQTMGKKARAKQTPRNATLVASGTVMDESSSEDKLIAGKCGSRNTSAVDSVSADVHAENSDMPLRNRNPRGSRRPANAKFHTDTVTRFKEGGVKPCPRNHLATATYKDGRSTSKKSGMSDGWDPYTEYGEWGGEAIEVVNSNASFARGMQIEASLADELLVDPEAKTACDPSECSLHVSNESLSPKSTIQSDEDCIFISKASTKSPPPAFSNLPDVPVFLVPDLLPQVYSQWRFKFGGEPCTPHAQFRMLPEKSTSGNMLRSQQPLSTKMQNDLSHGTSGRSEVEPQGYSFVPPPSSVATTGFEVSKGSGNRVLDGPAHVENNSELTTSKYSTGHFQNTNVTQKPHAFSSTQKAQSTFSPDRPNTQSGFLETSLKSYLLDNLPSEIGKLSVNDSSSQNTASVQFNLPSVSQPSQAVGSCFHNQVGGSSLQMNKVPVPHMTAHGSMHTSQQPMVSGSSQPQATTLPPGMPHFISQFAPPAYHMFNLSGNPSNPPAIFDLEHLQLLQQQQRMFYDMHLQQHAATTAQSLLTSSSESPATTKSHIAGAMGHVTATNTAIRPDMLAPQMLPPGHPYFSYPGFVVMNGYTNPFLNQQQSGADGGQIQNTTHGGPSITQHQSQSTGSQSFSGLKPVYTSGTAYEEFLHLKYGDPSKQVGFKTNAQPSGNFGPFQGQVTPMDGSKIPNVHSASGVLAQEFNMNSGGGGGGPQPFSPQFYPSGAAASPYLTAAAAAVAVAAAAAASAQQQQQQASSVGNATNQSNAGVSTTVGGVGGQPTGNPGGHTQMHLPNNPTQALVMGSGPNLHHSHHQRPVISRQH